MWWAERDLERPYPSGDGKELLALKKLGVLVEGEWEAARSRLRESALPPWIGDGESNAKRTADRLGVPLAWVHEWWGSTKKSKKRRGMKGEV